MSAFDGASTGRPLGSIGCLRGPDTGSVDARCTRCSCSQLTAHLEQIGGQYFHLVAHGGQGLDQGMAVALVTPVAAGCLTHPWAIIIAHLMATLERSRSIGVEELSIPPPVLSPASFHSCGYQSPGCSGRPEVGTRQPQYPCAHPIPISV